MVTVIVVYDGKRVSSYGNLSINVCRITASVFVWCIVNLYQFAGHEYDS